MIDVNNNKGHNRREQQEQPTTDKKETEIEDELQERQDQPTAENQETEHEDELQESSKEIPEAEKLRSTSCSDIFIRKILKSDKCKSGKLKKGRVYNSYHACFLCKKLVQHIPTHIKQHSTVPEVRKVVDKTSVDYKAHMKIYEGNLSLLRAKGDHFHNLRVIEAKEGELFMSRRPKEEFQHENYGPCPKCFEWLKINSLVKHTNTCSGYQLGGASYQTNQKVCAGSI